MVHPGFYMSPIDPEGNNWLIYVLKNKLKDFQILGLRAAPKNMRGLIAAKPRRWKRTHNLRFSGLWAVYGHSAGHLATQEAFKLRLAGGP